jgi:cobalt/nickel transport system ATP-binding protein
MKPIIAFENLCFSYDDQPDVLSNVSFAIKEGESVALIGANGAGKSTLLLHTNGIHCGHRGRVTIGDMPVNPKTLAHARQKVGLVFQDPDNQLFMPTVEQDVAFGPKNMGLPTPEIERRVNESLAMVDSLALKKRFSHKLSGGEKRRVALATVLAMQPELLVLDEPSAHLDPRSRSRLIATLKALSHAKLIATHDLDLAWDLCERTIILHQGRIVFDGKTSQAFDDDEALLRWELEKPLRLHECPQCASFRRQFP